MASKLATYPSPPFHPSSPVLNAPNQASPQHKPVHPTNPHYRSPYGNTESARACAHGWARKLPTLSCSKGRISFHVGHNPAHMPTLRPTHVCATIDLAECNILVCGTPKLGLYSLRRKPDDHGHNGIATCGDCKDVGRKMYSIMQH